MLDSIAENIIVLHAPYILVAAVKSANTLIKAFGNSQKEEAMPRVELGSPDSESGVITTTLHSRSVCEVGFNKAICNVQAMINIALATKWFFSLQRSRR